MRSWIWMLLLGCVLGGSAPEVRAQGAVPGFAGNWRLDLKRSKLETKHPPSAGTAKIEFDGRTWRYTRTHSYAAQKPETWSIVLEVGAAKAHMEKDGPLTFASRMSRQGDALVLREDITASDGEKAKNTVRYTLQDGGRTLVEDEHKETPRGSERNRWVFGRVR